MRNEKGITMIALVLVIILMLILTTTGVFTGIDAYKTMRAQTFVAQMKVAQEKINIIRDEYEAWDNYKGNNINEYIMERYTLLNDDRTEIIAQPIYLSTYPDTDNTKRAFLDILANKTELRGEDLILQNYYYFPADYLDKLFGLSNLDIDIIINFNTGTFVEKTGVEATTIFGKTTRFYVLDELVNMQNLNFNPSHSGGGASPGLESPALAVQSVRIKEFDELNQKTIIELKINSLNEILNIAFQDSSGTNIIDDLDFSRSNMLIEVKVDISYIGFYMFEITDAQGTARSPLIEIVRVNAPKAINTGITKITWNGAQEVLITEDNIDDWYNYGSSKKRWANIKTPDGSYYVWIPRFAYKMKNNGKIEVKFLRGTTNTTFDGLTIKEDYGTDGFVVHPAFRLGQYNAAAGINEKYGNGEYTKELSGIWVAKYESYIEPIEGQAISYLLKSIPGKSLTTNPGLTFENAVVAARDIERYMDLYGFDIDYEGNRGTYYSTLAPNNDALANVDTHMIKNSEWGAVTYLAMSDYGVNDGYETSSSLVTGEGLAVGTEDYARKSTTGNMNGVFDLTNGNTEFVSAITESAFSSFSYVKLAERDGTGKIISNPYLTMFDGVLDNNSKVGDGIYELKFFTGFDVNEKVYFDTDKEVLTRGGDGYFDYVATKTSDTTESGQYGIRVVFIME